MTNKADDGQVRTFPMAAATPLAYALVSRLAATAGIRALAVKGPVLEHFGLRGHKVSGDADILVDPDDFGTFCSAIEALGWGERPVRYSPSILVPHSKTYIHPHWPCDIDVHSYFPGFFAEPRQIFDHLWETRWHVSLAGTEVTVPSREGNAVIALLHILRGSSDADSSIAYGEVMTALERTNSAEQQTAIESIVRAGQCGRVLAKELSVLGVAGDFDDVSDDLLGRWELNRQTHPIATTGSWLFAIRTAPWREKLFILGRAVYPSKDELRKDPGTANAGPLALTAKRIRRLAHGAKTLPSATASLLRAWKRR